MAYRLAPEWVKWLQEQVLTAKQGVISRVVRLPQDQFGNRPFALEIFFDSSTRIIAWVIRAAKHLEVF